MNDIEKMRYLASTERTLVADTLSEWRASFPKMGVCAFLPEAQKDQVALLQAECARLKIPLVGAIFPALIHQGMFHTDGIWLLRFDVMPFYALHADLTAEPLGAEQQLNQITQQVVEQLAGTEEFTLFMLFDAIQHWLNVGWHVPAIGQPRPLRRGQRGQRNLPTDGLLV